MGNMINDIRTKTPDQLLNEGWQDVTDSRKAQNTMSREYYNPETGVKSVMIQERKVEQDLKR